MKSDSKKIYCGEISGRITVPSSKSITHRLLIIGALSEKRVEIRNPLFSDDTRITLTALQKMGYDATASANAVTFSGKKKNPEGPVKIWVENSGTSARLLSAVAAIQSVECHIDGTPRMRERPMNALIEALHDLGLNVSHRDRFLPIEIEDKKPAGGHVKVDASQSSQFLSALLLIAPCLEAGLTIIHQGIIASRAYADLTVALMKQAGIEVEVQPVYFRVRPGQTYQPRNTTVEGDFSSAAYFLTAAAISGGEVHITNLEEDSLQGDRIILDILEKAGAEVIWQSDGVMVRGNSLHGVDVDMHSFPDLVPTVAVLGLFCAGSTRLGNVAHLRFKESDRLQAIMENISRLQGKAFTEGDNLIIEPQRLKGASLPTYNDHRIAMSFALAGLRVPGVIIEHPGCANKSYPDFWEHFDLLHN